MKLMWLIALLGLGCARTIAPIPAAPAPVVDKATYGFLRYEVPQGFVESHRRSQLWYDLPGLPEGRFYRVFINMGMEAGPFERDFRDMWRDSGGMSAGGWTSPTPTITAFPQGHRLALGTYAGKNAKGTDDFCMAMGLMNMDGYEQTAGVVTNDIGLWKSREPWMKGFFASLEFDREGLAARAGRNHPLSSPLLPTTWAATPTAEQQRIVAAAKQVARAWFDGDEKTLRAMSIPTSDEDWEVVRYELEDGQLYLRLFRAIVKQFGPEAGASWPDDPLASQAEILDRIVQRPAIINGTSATLSWGDKPDDPSHAFTFVKEGDSWKVDAYGFLARGDAKLVHPGFKTLKEAQKDFRVRVERIEAGEFKTLREARAAVGL